MDATEIDLQRASIIPMGHPIPAAGGDRSPPGALTQATIAASRLPPSVARRAQNDLDRIELAEIIHRSGQKTKLSVAMLGGGFALALFPFTPGLVTACNPHHNPGWLCGARAAALLAAIEAALTCLFTSQAMWTERNTIPDRAAAMGVALQRDALRSGVEPPNASFYSAFLGASAQGRQRLRDHLEDATLQL